MRYREVGLLAEGGMAIIQKALTADGNEVVVKRVRPPFCFDTTYLKLFQDEGAVHAALQHENIVRLLDRGEDECGPFLVFEHVDGVDLAHVLEHAQCRCAPLELPAVLAIFIPLMKGLAAAHDACDETGAKLSLVHRDVSPGNVLIGTDGSVKLADFGVAASTLRQEATVAGEMKGKFAYMAPEQTRGERVTAQADLFAAGIVLWECLAGCRLFDGPTDADVVHAVRATEAPPLGDKRPGVPPELAALVASLLDKDPKRRPQSARAVADELAAIALAQGLDEGLARHAARLVREAPRRELKDATPDVRRRTQRVVGDTAATGVVVVERKSRPPLAAIAGAGLAGLGVLVVVVGGVLVGVGAKPAPAPGTAVQLPDASPVIAAPVASAAVAAAPVAAAPVATGPVAARVETPAITPPSAVAARAAALPLRTRTGPDAPRPRKDGAPPAIAAPATDGFGTLSLQAEPWAAVHIDGRLVKAETPLLRHTLAAGRHSVRLVNPVYKLEKTIEIDVVADQNVRTFVDLNQP